MPDLHPRKYGPVGCSILADRIHPPLIGSHIGCGRGLFQLDLAVRKLRVDKAAGYLRALDVPWEGGSGGRSRSCAYAGSMRPSALSTVGTTSVNCRRSKRSSCRKLPSKPGSMARKPTCSCIPAHEGLAIRSCSGNWRRMRHRSTPASENGRAYLAEHDHSRALGGAEPARDSNARGGSTGRD